MKKILFSLVLFLSPLPAIAATLSADPTSINSYLDPLGQTEITFDNEGLGTAKWGLYLPDLLTCDSGATSVSYSLFDLTDPDPMPLGIYHLIAFDGEPSCNYFDDIASPNYLNVDVEINVFYPPSYGLAGAIDISDTFGSVAEGSGAIFEALGGGGIIEIVAGLLIGGMIAAYLIRGVMRGTKKAIGQPRRKSTILRNTRGEFMGYRFHN